jgi:hypothetical protein
MSKSYQVTLKASPWRVSVIMRARQTWKRQWLRTRRVRKWLRLWTRQAWKRRRSWLPGIVVIALAIATIATIIWLHSAARNSSDAWPTSVAAGTTAALALITMWYAYLTHRLLETQRAGPRIAGWETALRELSPYLNRQRNIVWEVTGAFPLGDPDNEPPTLQALMEVIDAFRSTREHLLEIMGLLPRKFVAESLMLAARLVDAEQELFVLLTAMTKVQKEALDNGGDSWSWDEVESAYEATRNEEESESWPDILRGRYFRVAERHFDEMSTKVDLHLVDYY